MFMKFILRMTTLSLGGMILFDAIVCWRTRGRLAGVAAEHLHGSSYRMVAWWSYWITSRYRYLGESMHYLVFIF